MNKEHLKVAAGVAMWTLPFLIPGVVFAARDGIDSTKAIGLLATAGTVLLIMTIMSCWSIRNKESYNKDELRHQMTDEDEDSLSHSQ